MAAFDDSLRRHSIDTVKSAIDAGIHFPVDRMVMHSMGIWSRDGAIPGSYERMIDSIAELADYAAAKKLYCASKIRLCTCRIWNGSAPLQRTGSRSPVM